MEFKKNANYPVFLLLIAIIILWGFSLLPGNFTILGIKIKKIDIFSDIKPDSLISCKISPEFNSFGGLYGIILPLSYSIISNADRLSGNTAQMSFFYNALKDYKNRKVRIAHYGDSIIEGDLISADLRTALQKKFGGEGIGITSLTSEGIKFRITVKHTFSDDWKTFSVYSGNLNNIPPGITGTVSIPSSGSWVKLEASGIPGTFKSIKKVHIYYSNAKNSSLKYSLNNSAEKTIQLSSGKGIKEIVIDGENSRSIKITASIKDQAYFYGISIESDEGIILDNFPLRGNSGVSLREIPAETMMEFNKLLDYKLIILQFGLNMLTSGQTDYTWYEKEMEKVIIQLKENFPQTSFLLVGVGDKCVKKGTRLTTDPNVKKLIAVQKRIAENTDIAFWNLFESMGGENSMLDWVNSKPPLAMRDYTHFNNDGAAKIGKMIFESVLEDYK